MLKTKLCKAVSLVFAAAFLLGGCSDVAVNDGLLADSIASPEDIHYNTTTVERVDYEAVSTGTASINYMIKTSLYWENGEARYHQTRVKAGQRVAAGDVLMTFHVAVSESKLAELETRLNKQWRDYVEGVDKRKAAIAAEEVRAQTLSGYDLEISGYTLERLQAEYEQFVYQAEHEMTKLQEQINQLEATAENNTLYAPFDGVIDSVIQNTEGNNVSTTKPLIVMHAEDVILLNVKSGADDLRYNMPVTIEYGTNANLKTFTGRVIAAPNILPSDVSFDKVMILVDQDLSGENIRGNLKLNFITKELGDILVTNREAVSGSGAETYVYVLENDTLHKRFVVTRREDGQTVWILDGLAKGQTLVLD